MFLGFGIIYLQQTVSEEFFMKIKQTLFAVLMLTVLCVGIALCACNSVMPAYKQQLNYTESTAKINNPDQGFYRPIYVKLNGNGITYNKNIVNDSTQLYHLRIDISAFSKQVNGSADIPLTQTALDGLDELLSFVKSKDKNAIVRFAYDPSYGGSKDKEPQLSIILQHIEQVCTVINNYNSTVTAVEVGLIGPWGEMHSSAIANAQNITPIIEAFVTHTNAVPLLVRTPKMIYDYLGITVNDVDDYVIDANSKAYRLGIYNDGYLGSANDLGTYTDRQRETEFLSKQTAHLPYGGEVVIPSSEYHDIDKCLPEMNLLNLSYLNIEWNNQVIDKWKNSNYTKQCGQDELFYGKTAFDYIQNHLGYRFVLTNSVFKYTSKADELQIELTLKNVGFGNLNKTSHTKLIFADSDGKVAYTCQAQDFKGDSSYNCSLKLNLPNGNYQVYLCLYQDELENNPLYCLQFANDGLWNAELKSNKIGEVTVANE